MSSSSRSPSGRNRNSCESTSRLSSRSRSKRLLHDGGKALVGHGNIHLQIGAERACVHVECADRTPVPVDHRRLGVQHVPLPLEDTHAVTHQTAPHGAAGVSNDLHVAHARHQHADVGAAPRRALERADDHAIRNEIRVGNPDAALGAVQVLQVRADDLAAVPGEVLAKHTDLLRAALPGRRRRRAPPPAARRSRAASCAGRCRLGRRRPDLRAAPCRRASHARPGRTAATGRRC